MRRPPNSSPPFQEVFKLNSNNGQLLGSHGWENSVGRVLHQECCVQNLTWMGDELTIGSCGSGHPEAEVSVTCYE